MASVLTLRCPHCREWGKIRSSRPVTPLVTDLHVACSDIECGHTFAAQLSILRTISPSSSPNPAVVLPIAPPRARMTKRRPAANDNNLDQAAQG